MQPRCPGGAHRIDGHDPQSVCRVSQKSYVEQTLREFSVNLNKGTRSAIRFGYLVYNQILDFLILPHSEPSSQHDFWYVSSQINAGPDVLQGIGKINNARLLQRRIVSSKRFAIALYGGFGTYV